MLVGLLSDAHGNLYGLQAALHALKKNMPDLIIFAGDMVGYYPFVNETIDLIRAENIACVMGNHDAMLTGRLSTTPERLQAYKLDTAQAVIRSDNREWLAELPEKRQFDLEGVILEVYHGSPWQPLKEYIYPDHQHFERFAQLTCDVVILGHTHWQFQRQVDGVTIINPGSCGQPRDYQPGACYALLNTQIHETSLHRQAYNLRPIIDAVSDPALVDILLRTKA